MSIIKQERETYETVWSIDAYSERSPGVQYLPLFLDMARPAKHSTVLDAGCGSGKGGLALRDAGFDVCLCDLTVAGLSEEACALSFSEVCLWDPLEQQLKYLFGGKVDYVYCCDVLEHIPTPFTMLVVSRMLEVAREGVFLSISLMPDQFGAWVGKPLHQTVQSFPAWKEQLEALATVKECRDLLHCGVYLLEAR